MRSFQAQFDLGRRPLAPWRYSLTIRRTDSLCLHVLTRTCSLQLDKVGKTTQSAAAKAQENPKEKPAKTVKRKRPTTPSAATKKVSRQPTCLIPFYAPWGFTHVSYSNRRLHEPRRPRRWSIRAVYINPRYSSNEIQTFPSYGCVIMGMLPEDSSKREPSRQPSSGSC